MARRLALGWAIMGSASLAGCGLLLDYGGLGGGGAATTSSTSQTGGGGTTTSTTSSTSASTSSSTGSGGADGGTDAGSDGGGAGPVLPPVEVKLANFDFLIDATEVTAAEYLAFVKANAQQPFPPSGDRCTWNTAVTPNTPPPGNDAGIGASSACLAYDLATEAAARPHAPVRCVDWCDAFTYCEWSGGWLCHGDEAGKYGREWRVACQNDTMQDYPYGMAYQQAWCVDSTSAPADVHSKPMCQGGLAGLFDMSGNIAEWIDCGCEYDDTDPLNTSPYVAGGSYKDPSTEVTCTASRREKISTFHVDVGFRCCRAP